MSLERKQQNYLNSAFIRAAADNQGDILHFLRIAGANIHSCNDFALMRAAMNGHAGIVEYLLLHGANPHGLQATELARKNGHDRTVQVLDKWMEDQREQRRVYPSFSPRCAID